MQAEPKRLACILTIPGLESILPQPVPFLYGDCQTYFPALGHTMEHRKIFHRILYTMVVKFQKMGYTKVTIFLGCSTALSF